jgi:ABC-type glycerol-3-phosphate transport system permease component
VLLKIVVPISMPAIFAVGMYAFIQAWNEFILALVLTTDSSVRPVSVGLSMFLGEYYIDWGALMAASAVMTIPSMIVFLLFQGQLVAGLSEGAVKG